MSVPYEIIESIDTFFKINQIKEVEIPNDITDPLQDEKELIISDVQEFQGTLDTFIQLRKKIYKLSQLQREIVCKMKADDLELCLKQSKLLSDTKVKYKKTVVDHDECFGLLNKTVDLMFQKIQTDVDRLKHYLQVQHQRTHAQSHENEKFLDGERDKPAPLPYLGRSFHNGTFTSPIYIEKNELLAILQQFAADFASILSNNSKENDKVIIEFGSPNPSNYASQMWNVLCGKKLFEPKKIKLVYQYYNILLPAESPIGKAVDRYEFLCDEEAWPIDPRYILDKSQKLKEIRDQLTQMKLLG